MTARQRLGLSLAVFVGVGGILYAVAEWRSRRPMPPPPQVEGAAGPGQTRGQARVEALRAAIEAQRAALGEARQQRGAVSAELERMIDELALARDEIEGLQKVVKQEDNTQKRSD